MSIVDPTLDPCCVVVVDAAATWWQDPTYLYKTLNISFNRKAMYIFISCIYILVLWRTVQHIYV